MTIEKTGKGWKAIGCLSLAVFFFGLLLLIFGVMVPAAAIAIIGGILIAASLAIYIVGRAGAWWYHG
jgi:hypothetical protein